MADELYMLDEAAHVKQCLSKWAEATAKYDPKLRPIMAQIYENQWREQQLKMRAAQNAGLIEATDQTTSTFGVSAFPNSVVYPLIDQVFPNLIAQKICLVRPMRTSTANIQTKVRSFSGGSNFSHTGSTAKTTEGATVPKARMAYTSTTVTAEAYKLRAVYSLETAEDALRDGNINFETDMIRDMAEEIVGEIDWVILGAMYDAVTHDVPYSTTPDSNETVKEHQQELWDAIVDANNDVFADMQRNCNFIVGDADAVGRLEKLMNFAFVNGASDDVFNLGSVRVGTLNNQYAVFKSTNATAAKLLVGIAGEAYMYCPYIPLALTPVEYEHATDEAVRGVRTRFGKALLRANALATVTIS
jgi:hypothetical protein